MFFMLPLVKLSNFILLFYFFYCIGDMSVADISLLCYRPGLLLGRAVKQSIKKKKITINR